MRNFEIWSEGNNPGEADYYGEGYGSTFQEACENFAKNDKDFVRCFDLDNLTFWGRKLFDNEKDAKEYNT